MRLYRSPRVLWSSSGVRSAGSIVTAKEARLPPMVPHATRAGRDRTIALLLSVALVLTVLVHRRSLGSFFGADDLIHLEQAYGLAPTPLVPWRLLTQVLYFRTMVQLVGPVPAPYMLVNLLLHALNVGLLFSLVSRLTPRRWIAVLAAGLFGMHPLHVEVLFRAVTINETASCACALGAAWCLLRPGRWRLLLGTGLFAVGMLCKESILALPLAFAFTLAPGERDRQRTLRALPTIVVALVFGAAFLALRRTGSAPGGVPYAMHFGANVFHNAMTYLMWASDWVRPLPDLVRSFDPLAWRAAIWVLGALILLAWRGPQKSIVRWGLVWWIAALLPVLVLQNSTYGHYAYVSLAGLATATAASLDGLAQSLFRRRGSVSPPAAAPARLHRPGVPALVVLLALGLVAWRADALIDARLRLPIPGTDLPLDSFLRTIEISRRAVLTMGQNLPADMTRAVIFIPEGTLSTFGARSGSNYGPARLRRRGHVLVESVMDEGRAFRLFYPQLDSVRFLTRWSARYRDWYLIVQVGDGFLEHRGVGPLAHARYAWRLLDAGLDADARSYLSELVKAFPTDRTIRSLYGSELARTGDLREARLQLQQVLRTAPDDTLAVRALQLLDSVSRSRSARK
jgi:hypothetical protein